MEDIKKRLELNNSVIKQQTVKKIYDQVLRIKDEEINDCTPQTHELKFLWEKCGDNDPIVSTSCCQALLELLRCGKAQLGYILKGLLNAIPNAKNLNGILKTVTDILVLQMVMLVEKSNAYKNPYAIRNPPHPYITILTNRPDSWVLLNQQVHRVLKWSNNVFQNPEDKVEFLSPFLKFVLLEPAKSIQFAQLRLSLLTTCIQAVSTYDKNATDDVEQHVIGFLLSLIPCLQVESSSAVGEATQFIYIISNHVLSSTSTYSNNDEANRKTSHNLNRNKDHDNYSPPPTLLEILVNHILALMSSCINEGLDIRLLIDTIMHILRKNQQMFLSESIVPELISLLLKSPSHNQRGLLQLVNIYIENASSSPQDKKYPLLYGLLYMPLLNILTSSDPLYTDDGKHSQKLASHILTAVEKLSHASSEPTKCSPASLELGMTADFYQSDLVAKLCQDLSAGSLNDLNQWLTGVHKCLSDGNTKASVNTLCLVVAMFSSRDETGIIEKCLHLFETIAKIDPSQSISLLPVLLYKINRVSSPHMKLQILKTLPKIATHKVSMAPILKSLQLLGGSPQLKALSIRLITSLWQQQDRCFPYLQQLLLEKDFGGGMVAGTGINEVVLAKAASIRDICKLRPHQHGEDMVQPLSAILNECSHEGDAPSVSLALEGLYYLCEAEVIDIHTAWSVLAAKLSKDTRPLVIKGICELFSLVPSLSSGNDSLEPFSSEVLSLLWKFANSNSDDPLIVNAAFQALSKFSAESFGISHLPKQVTKDLIESVLAEMPEEFEIDEKSLPDITGDCYTKMLMSLNQKYLQGFECFLTSLVHNEVANMPRGIHYTATRRQTASANQNKAIASVPQFLLSEYEKNKQPGLRPGLAAGLLFGYDPPMQVGRDGKPRKNHIAEYGRQYHQMLYTLINEVPIQPSEWHKSVVTPNAWTAFMDRCYLAYLEGRKAELQMKLQRGQSQSPDENQLQQDTAWLWTRDKLTELIKSCSRGSPTSQGNSMCALVGLAVTTCKYASSLDQDMVKLCMEEATEYTSQSHWVNMVTNTVLAVMDFAYQPVGRIFSMCQQRNEKERTPASLLARSGAAIAISQLIPSLISINADMIYNILDMLCTRLPGISDVEDAGVIQFHYGLGVGSTLAALFEEKFLDIAGTQATKAVWKAVDMLEKSVFSESDTRMGSVLGLGVCLTAMCKDGKSDTKVRVCKLQTQLTTMTEQLDKENNIYEAACVSLACVTASAYAANILSQDIADRTVANIYTSHVENPHLLGASLALGMVCSGLLLAEHPAVKDLHEKLLYTWITQIQDEDIPSINKVSSVHGMIAIVGSNNNLLQIPSAGTSPQIVQTSDLVKAVTNGFHKSSDIGLKSCFPWLLGQFYLSSFALGDCKNSVPSTYHYLPDISILKSCVDVLIDAGKIGPAGITKSQIHSILKAFCEGPNQALPPINWPAILSPLIRMKFGPEVECQCLLLAEKQGPSSPSAAMFVTTWILSPLYDSLSNLTKLMLYDSLPIIIKVVPPAKLEEYFNHGFLSSFNSTEKGLDIVHCERAIQGLCGALKVNDPPQSVTMLLYDTLHTLYHSEAIQLHVSLLHLVCRCLQVIPDTQVDKITENDFKEKSSFTVGVFTRCYLVGLGCQPLTWLNSAIESILYADKSQQEQSLLLLLKCFISTNGHESEVCNLSSKTQWLLELMGHCKNIAYGRVDLNLKENQLLQVTEFMVQIFASAILAWCSSGTKCLFGLPSFTVYGKRNDQILNQGESDNKYGNLLSSGLQESHIGMLVTGVLPSCLNRLFAVEPWKQLTPKVIDWFIALDNAEMTQNEPVKGLLKGSLYALRHSKEFSKVDTWSKTFSLNV